MLVELWNNALHSFAFLYRTVPQLQISTYIIVPSSSTGEFVSILWTRLDSTSSLLLLRLRLPLRTKVGSNTIVSALEREDQHRAYVPLLYYRETRNCNLQGHHALVGHDLVFLAQVKANFKNNYYSWTQPATVLSDVAIKGLRKDELQLSINENVSS